MQPEGAVHEIIGQFAHQALGVDEEFDAHQLVSGCSVPRLVERIHPHGLQWSRNAIGTGGPEGPPRPSRAKSSAAA